MTELQGLTVIIVDDEPDSLTLAREVCTLQGATVHETGSSGAVIKMLETITPDLIITDLAMPDPDGWGVLRYVRSQPHLAAIPVIAMTAFYSDTVEREAQAAGFDGFVAKPFKAITLMTVLREVRANRR
jgi:CheY-like chemotaxis protein